MDGERRQRRTDERPYPVKAAERRDLFSGLDARLARIDTLLAEHDGDRGDAAAMRR